MKCFRHSSRHVAASESGEMDCGPETIPGSPIADQSNGLKRGFPRRRSQ